MSSATDKINEQYELDQNHLNHPEAGDYWHDHFTPVFVVLHVSKDYVIITQSKIEHPKDKSWRWDINKFDLYSREDFKRKLRYSPNTQNDRTWAHVSPKCHVHFSDSWMEMILRLAECQ